MVIATPLTSTEQQVHSVPADALYEIVAGQIVEIEPMGMLAGTFANYLVYFINSFAIPRKLGTAFVEVLFNFGPGLPQRRPDVSFVPASRWPANLTSQNDPAALDAIPSLAVEVVSPGNTAAEIEIKRQEYFEAGVTAVWVVFPAVQTVHVFNTPDECRVISRDGILDGSAAIPGFQVKLADIIDCMFPSAPNSSNAIPETAL